VSKSRSDRQSLADEQASRAEAAAQASTQARQQGQRVEGQGVEGAAVDGVRLAQWGETEDSGTVDTVRGWPG